MQDGEFPQHDSEIALEASALSKLGKNYTIGQEIDFTVLFDAESEESVEGIKIPVECTFTLCGVLREYSSLWQLSENKLSKPICGALVTNTAGENLRTKAIETAAQMNEQSTAGAAACFGRGSKPVNSFLKLMKRNADRQRRVSMHTCKKHVAEQMRTKLFA